MTIESADEGARGGELEGISSLHVSRLLELGFSRERQPIDGLLARLRGPRGAAWLRATLQGGRLGPSADLDAITSPQGVSISLLRALKDRANVLLKDPAKRENLHAGMAGYFLAIAAAIAQHGELLTQQPCEKIAPILRKLSTVVPEPWGPIFRCALDSPRLKPRNA